MIQTEAAPKLSRNEGLKDRHPHLEGTIAQALSDSSTDHFNEDDYEFLKFHGVYQQDDRDKRKQGKHYQLMVRTRFPGGTLNADQYLVCDALGDEFGDGSLRITTRQDFQFHGVLKSNLRETIRRLNAALMTTIAACGDVARNVMASPTPSTSPLIEKILADARMLSLALSPTTPAYHRIWVEGEELELKEAAGPLDPLYGRNYLPRKFKTAFAIPPLNDTDVFTNDLGFVAIVEGDQLLGYNLLAGGGLGKSHGNVQTFPRLADVLGFFAPEHLESVAKAVLAVHRDFGDRTNRRHARLKYVIAERGVDWCRTEVEKRIGFSLEPARPFAFTRQGDILGWHQQLDGRWFLGLFIENGRIRDREGYRIKTALREVIAAHRPEVRLTASQNLLIVGVQEADRAAISAALARHGVSVDNPFSRTRKASMACPSLPTCGLALAESERVLPGFITRFEGLLDELQLGTEEVVIRMTGCPNGCSRPYTAELALVGRAPEKYQVFVGGNEGSTRLNRLWKDSVRSDELIQELRPLLKRFISERVAGERLGDFCARVIWPETPETPAAS
jgi:sulfite reductase (NADPH) hemoprotein beta-component